MLFRMTSAQITACKRYNMDFSTAYLIKQEKYNNVFSSWALVLLREAWKVCMNVKRELWSDWLNKLSIERTFV